MKIGDLKAGQGKVDVEVVVKAKADTRTFNKYGKDLKVCNATVTDSESDITLSLWNDDIEKINIGDKLKITNGYVSEFNGQLQLSAGKFGKMEVVGKGDASASAPPASKSAPSEKPSDTGEKPASAKKEEPVEDLDESELDDDLDDGLEEEFEEKEF